MYRTGYLRSRRSGGFIYYSLELNNIVVLNKEYILLRERDREKKKKWFYLKDYFIRKAFSTKFINAIFKRSVIFLKLNTATQDIKSFYYERALVENVKSYTLYR